MAVDTGGTYARVALTEVEDGSVVMLGEIADRAGKAAPLVKLIA